MESFIKINTKLLTTVLASSMLFCSNAFAKDVVPVATEPTFAPFDFVEDKTTKVVGLDIDIMMQSVKLKALRLIS